MNQIQEQQQGTATFLESVARDLIGKYGHDLSRTAVVFPNKRASLFLNEALARLSGRPIWSPAYITISELFRAHSDLKVGDPIKLICDLYKSYVDCTGSDETLDHFFGWGQVMLADFDDIDKNMADAEKVFSNVRDIHELDDVSYIDPEQAEIIRRFFSNFSEEKNTELKRRFLDMWCHFHDIYLQFNQRLREQGLAYEGALYREVAGNDGIDYRYDRYVFVGFNVLQRVEQRIFDRLKRLDKAVFYWDFDTYYISHNHEAGHYIASYLADYPNELDIDDGSVYDNFKREKDITYVSAPTEDIQARYASQWLRQNHRIADGKQTAVVMCNEGLLQTVIHCIPDEADKVNITTGYPLDQSPLCSLVDLLFDLRTDGYVVAKGRYRIKQVNAILRHPYARLITASHGQLWHALNEENKRFYPSADDLVIDEDTEVLFGLLPEDDKKTSNRDIIRWIQRILRLIAHHSREGGQQGQDKAAPLFQESLFKLYTILNRLADLIEHGDLTVDLITLRRLLDQVVRSTSIPFHGEPAIGIQFMGVLETRNLDFKHLLVLSCNEGNMPKGVNDTSFIPYSIRKAHGLTTIDNKVAIYAYYFHRLLQRARDITLVYNDSANETSTGEMSRFMLQLLAESGLPIRRMSLRAEMSAGQLQKVAIEKTPDVMKILHRRFDRACNPSQTSPLLTPTAINVYNRCPLQFYYRYVAGINPQLSEEDDEKIDNATFGNIFHNAAQAIYERLCDGGKNMLFDKRLLESLYSSDGYLSGVLSEMFNQELFNIPADSKFQPSYNGLQLINFKVILAYLKQLVKVDTQLAPFSILGLETEVKRPMTVGKGDRSFQTTIGGRIDRLDCVDDAGGNARIRVIDYKTGGRKMTKHLAHVDAIFDGTGEACHADYYLQTFLYASIVRHDPQINPGEVAVSPSLLFIQHASVADYDPTLIMDSKRILDIADHEQRFNELLQLNVDEIFDDSIPFSPGDAVKCDTCPFRPLCGQRKKQ